MSLLEKYDYKHLHSVVAPPQCWNWYRGQI